MSISLNIAHGSVPQRPPGSATEVALERGFLRWQCRVRQIAVREAMGRPDDASRPAVTLHGAINPFGRITTVLSKKHPYSKTPELQHLARQTNDPAQRREKAIQFLSENYYQRANEFSGELTATFPPGSEVARRIKGAQKCLLSFDAYGQRFDLHSEVTQLSSDNPLYEATWWHNALFNPSLHPETVVLGFQPDWALSTAAPPMS